MYAPLAETSADTNYWTAGNSILASALGVWERVEQIKAVKSSSGQDQLQQMVTPQLENGAAVQVDSQFVSTKDSSGIKINKELLYVSLGLLGVALLFKAKGF